MSNHVHPTRILAVLKATRSALAELNWIQGYSYQRSNPDPAYAATETGALVWRANALPQGRIDVEHVCGVCLAGAACLASYQLFGQTWQDPCIAAEQVLEEVSGFRSVTAFNDFPLRTKAEVLELVDQAITTIEGRLE